MSQHCRRDKGRWASHLPQRRSWSESGTLPTKDRQHESHYSLPRSFTLTASAYASIRTHRNPHQNSPSHQRLNILRKERNEDKGDHRNQRPNHRETISVSLSNNTIDKQAQNLTNPSSIRQSTLPRSSDLEFPGRVLNSEFPVEGWESEERGDEDCVCHDQAWSARAYRTN